MKTVIDGKEWILQHLNAKRPSISGAIYIDKRITIDKEDIVINDIAMSGRQIQRGFFNVNCYVPNLTVTQGSTKIQVPNKKRLKEIASEVCAVLEEVYVNQRYNLSIENQQQLEEVSENASYMNFRVYLNVFN